MDKLFFEPEIEIVEFAVLDRIGFIEIDPDEGVPSIPGLEEDFM